MTAERFSAIIEYCSACSVFLIFLSFRSPTDIFWDARRLARLVCSDSKKLFSRKSSKSFLTLHSSLCNASGAFIVSYNKGNGVKFERRRAREGEIREATKYHLKRYSLSRMFEGSFSEDSVFVWHASFVETKRAQNGT